MGEYSENLDCMASRNRACVRALFSKSINLQLFVVCRSSKQKWYIKVLELKVKVKVSLKLKLEALFTSTNLKLHRAGCRYRHLTKLTKQ